MLLCTLALVLPIQQGFILPHCMQHQTQKKEIQILRITVGGDKLSYDVPLSTPTADFTTAKLNFNSAFSTPDAKYLIVDVKNLYLNNTMNKLEYYKISLSLVPQEIIYKYDLTIKQVDGFVFIRVKKLYTA